MSDKWSRTDFISLEENYSQEYRGNLLFCIILQIVFQYIFTGKIFNFSEYHTVGWIAQSLYMIFAFILSSIFARRNTEKYTLWLDKNTEYE
jgi:hypothetical protein